MKNKRKVLALLSIISILYIGLFYYYITNYVKKDIIKQKINIPNSAINVEKVLKFVKENKIYYLDNLNSSYNEKEMSNQNKLRYLYFAIKDDVNFKDGVSYTKFETYIKKVFGNKATIKNENILNNSKENILIYDKTNEIYKYSDDIASYDLFYSSYDNVVDFKIEDDKYILTVNKFFIVDDKVYANIDNAKKGINALFEISDMKDNNYIKNYINEHSDEIKKKLCTFKYYFTKENGQLILLKYEKINKSVKKS